MQSSWKLSLRTAFKNFRRGFLKENTATDKSALPPAKRLKYSSIDKPDISEEEYEDAVKQLQGKDIIFCVFKLSAYMHILNLQRSLGKERREVNTAL